ncbi:hypothetical protein [Olleya sp. HaHaR_3_96]|uniref:hypothetical protein n=1 Tax=Olleya sp. HaHaR_3_96 TaxID=2745560 RepID=UPI001C4E9F34|nr:hypothetical protein [Olleya sp. HaHaR_3_96]QXP58999.1 hypothetical protein H0I26_13885 [Olleya sp. HaHaR_3_96]
MTQIKISIKAYGLAPNDFIGKESLQEKIVTKDTLDPQLTETDLKQILETLIASVKDIKTLYPDQQTNMIRHNDNRLESIKFEVISFDNTDVYQTLDEKALFQQIAKYNNLAPLLLDYCKVTDDGEEGSRIMITHDYDEGPPAGTYAILALVDRNKKWISNYIEFLRTNDLDHEVEQMWDIKSIIKKYGWCKETYQLAIARNISCCGQSGKEQFKSLIKEGLKASLDNKNNKTLFLDSILKEFQEWDAFQFRLKEGSKDYFQKYVVSYVRHFDTILTTSEIAKIEIFLLHKWDEFNEYHNLE